MAMMEPQHAMLWVAVISFTVSTLSPRTWFRPAAWLLVPLVVGFFSVPDRWAIFRGLPTSLGTGLTIQMMLIYAIAGLPVSGASTGLGYILRQGVIKLCMRLRTSPQRSGVNPS